MKDIRNKYTLRHLIVEIVEASVSPGLCILRDLIGLKKIDGYTTVFRRLVETGVLSSRTGLDMGKLVRLRNLVIHRYWEV